ncbi:MAG: YXWGXW repeat-containing protein [Chthoniobacterales bacterium]
MKIKLLLVVLLGLVSAAVSAPSASAYVGVSVSIAPPGIPLYTQPYCPGPGYLWTPGYWGYSDFGYYWVPGSWVYPPRIGYYWTPGYWGYRGGSYSFNQGYWGPTVGFYGGINYGYGYTGRGYYGGQWVGRTFRYNTAASRVNTNLIRNTYVNREVLNNNRGSRAGFNGPGGASARPNRRELAAANKPHVAATQTQRAQVERARKDPALHAKNNSGKPKPEAVRTFHSNNKPERATAASRRSPEVRRAQPEGNRQNARQTNANRRPQGQDRAAAQRRAATRQNRPEQRVRSVERNSRSSNADRANRDAAASAHRAAQARRERETRRAPAQTRSTRTAPNVQRRSSNVQRRPQTIQRRPQAVQRRPQTIQRPAQNVRSRQAAPSQDRGRNEAPQRGKKKKRANDNNDGR